MVLTLTSEAASRVRRLIALQESPARAGLRVAGADSSDLLKLSVAPGPDDADVVMQTAGVRVFVDPAVVRLAEDKVLEVSTGMHGFLQTITVAIRAQAPLNWRSGDPS
jgi:iron-sulfur cluster assembly protein